MWCVTGARLLGKPHMSWKWKNLRSIVHSGNAIENLGGQGDLASILIKPLEYNPHSNPSYPHHLPTISPLTLNPNNTVVSTFFTIITKPR